MEKPEFTAIQVTVLVRTHKGGSPKVKTFIDSVPFQYQLQDALGSLVKEQLRAGEVDFEEVIISLDTPAEKAKRVRSKSSFMNRLLGRE